MDCGSKTSLHHLFSLLCINFLACMYTLLHVSQGYIVIVSIAPVSLSHILVLGWFVWRIVAETVRLCLTKKPKLEAVSECALPAPCTAAGIFILLIKSITVFFFLKFLVLL